MQHLKGALSHSREEKSLRKQKELITKRKKFEAIYVKYTGRSERVAQSKPKRERFIINIIDQNLEMVGEV